MKRIFKQHLYDHLFHIISTNTWIMDYDCEKALNELVEVSIDKISHRDFEKKEMLSFAKTNLACLMSYMHIDCKARGLSHLDARSIKKALSQVSYLWPFKVKEEVVYTLNKYDQQPGRANFVWYY